MALGTARTCSSLSSSGVIILIRLGRLPEGESRVPPPLEAARASIVLLSFGTRAGRMRVRRVRFRVLANGARARPGRRRTTESFFKGTVVSPFLSTWVDGSASTAICVFFTPRSRAKSPQNPVDRARTVDFPRQSHPGRGCRRIPHPSHFIAARARAHASRVCLRRIGPSRDGQGDEEDAG